MTDMLVKLYNWAGPQKFYEKTVGAVAIPIHRPGSGKTGWVMWNDRAEYFSISHG